MVDDNILKSLKESSKDYRRLLYQTYEPEPLSEKDYRRFARTTHARVRDWLPEDLHTPILDLGCGVGNFLYLMEDLGYRDLTGVDLALARVEQARRRASRCRVLEGDLREVLAESPGRFGLITGFDILEHFPKEDILPLLTLMARALRPGGRLILQTPNGESPWVGAVGYGDFTHEWFFTPGSLAQLLRRVGLTDFAARECGPRAHGAKSFVRLLFWQILKAGLLGWNLIETGMAGSGIFTRVFLATARKP